MRSLLLIFLLLSGCSSPNDRVVLYCAQDRDFAQETLQRFTKRTSLEVVPKFDTESNKSVGLYVELIQDRHRPRCDVFWNNEILSTIRLQKEGMLQSYASPSAKSLPASYQASDHTWHAFSPRARVLIVHQSLPREQWPETLSDLTHPRFQGKIVLARPFHGTSATHVACLLASLGEAKTEELFQGLKRNRAHLAPGNKQVAEWVSQGKTPSGDQVLVGITDTDDAILEIKAHRNAGIVFPDSGQNGIGTLFIPNSISILKGCPNVRGARKLVDYLLSKEVERRLAETAGHQFPVRDPSVKMPEELRVGLKVKRMEVDFEKAATLWEKAQRMVQRIFR